MDHYDVIPRTCLRWSECHNTGLAGLLLADNLAEIGLPCEQETIIVIRDCPKRKKEKKIILKDLETS